MEQFGDKSLSICKIWLKSENDTTRPLAFKSFYTEDKNGLDKGVKGLINRLILKRFKDKFNTAVIYDRNTGKEIHKWINGVRKF